MIRALVLVGLTSVASAAPSPPTWADWVGDYAGTLTWKGCFTPGAARATISLDAIDGALVIELTDAGGGLRAMSLVDDEAGGWSAQQGDVTLRVKRPRANALSLDAEVGSDCRLTAKLVRPSTKIAACDRLIAWARIEARCTKLTAPPLEDPAKLAKERTAWKPRVKADAARCELRATTLEGSLADAGCALVANREGLLPGPHCQALTSAVAKLRQCATASRATIDHATRLALVPLIASTPAEREIVEADCQRLRRTAVSIAVAEHCPL
jgi:hypothetical protein